MGECDRVLDLYHEKIREEKPKPLAGDVPCFEPEALADLQTNNHPLCATTFTNAASERLNEFHRQFQIQYHFELNAILKRCESLPTSVIRKRALSATSTSSDKSLMENKLANQTGQDVVIYDGECVFCTSSVKILARLDSNDRLRFVSLHDPVVANDYPDLTYEQLMEQMWVVSANGQKSGGADAIAYLSTRLPMLYPFAPIIRFPGTMPLWRTLYRWVARLRYRIAGKQCDNGTCSLHHR